MDGDVWRDAFIAHRHFNRPQLKGRRGGVEAGGRCGAADGAVDV